MKTLRLIAPLLILLFGVSETSKAAFAFRLEPLAGVNLGALQVGQTFDLAVVVAFDPPEQISYFRLTENLSGSLLRVVNIAAGNAIPSDGTFTSGSTLTSYQVGSSGFTPITAPGTLAVITLTATLPGSGTISLGFPTYFGPSTADPVDYSGMNQRFTVIAPAIVPEPPSALLGLIAGGLAGAVRRCCSARPGGRGSVA